MRSGETSAAGLAELEQVLRAHWNPETFKRFQCLWLSKVLLLSTADIAAALGLHISTVRRIRAEFAQDGVRAILGRGNRGGRRNQCLSPEEEALFLRSHPELFSRSGGADVGALKAALEDRIGRGVHKTTVYRLLERHGRRRPGADPGPEAPAASGKRKAPSERRKKGGRAG